MMVKISFVGDIMCEPLLVKSAKRKNSFDFSDVFADTMELLSESDFVIGNLETPLAGKEAGIVNELFSFNAPDEFAEAIKDAGIDFVSTANNHCMDRGLKGLERTINVLDRIGLLHDGTHIKPYNNEPFIQEVKGLKIAIVPATYGTNFASHHIELEEKQCVDLLHSDTDPIYPPKIKKNKSFLKRLLLKPFKTEQIVAIKKALGMVYNSPRKDDYLDIASATPYFNRLKDKIDKAKKNSDIVFFYPHVGGQFNIEPGRFTEYTIEKALEFGVDAIVASHPHIVQKAIIKNNIPIYYSVGNYSMSPNSVYLLHDNLPEYGLVVHFYIEGKSIVNSTFSIIKMIEEKGRVLRVVPINQENARIEDIKKIYMTVTGREIDSVKREYNLVV